MTENKTKTESTKTEVAEKANPMDKLKPLFSLEPVLLNKWGARIAANIQKIYYCLLLVFGVLFIKAIMDWAYIGFGAFFFDLVMYGLLFLAVRLFSEKFAND